MKIINKEKYSFHPYNGEYPRLFEKEKLRIKKVLPDGALIEHVGSTSVPGLGGKGIIDIAIKTSKNKLNQFQSKLEKIGYEYRLSEHPANDKRIFLQKIIKSKRKERRIHIHLTLDDYFWNTFIALRDYLRSHDKERDKYSELKRKAVKFANGEGKKYRKFKDKFLQRLTKKALKEMQ